MLNGDESDRKEHVVLRPTLPRSVEMAGIGPFNSSEALELKRRLPEVPDVVISHFLSRVSQGLE